MKKSIVTLIALVIGAISANAQLDINDALTVAKNFYSKNSRHTILTTSLAHVELNKDEDVVYYVFDINDNDGYVIVPADYTLPISSYSTTGHYVIPKKHTPTTYHCSNIAVIDNWDASAWAILRS